MTRLPPTDYLTWRLQRDPVLQPTIVSVLMLDSRPDWNALIDAVDRCTRAVPELRRQLISSALPLTAPHWESDTWFDLSWHVQRASLIPRVDLDAVLEFARREAMTPFDPDRPLWRSTLLTSPDDSSGSALVLKIHHSLTDGISGVRILARLCDLERSPDPSTIRPAPPVQERANLRSSVIGECSQNFRSIQRNCSRSVAACLGLAKHPRQTARDGFELAVSLARLVRPITSTLSPVMVNRGYGRRLAAFEVPVDALVRAAHANGGTVNDAFLTAVLIGLRRYHLLHGFSVRSLRVTMPISLRTPDDPLGGNRISLSRFMMPADRTDPVDVMHRVHELVRCQVRERSIQHSGAVAAVLSRMPITLIAGILEHVDFVASDVPGSPAPLYLAGARIERLFAFSPTLGTALNVTMTSYAGTCFIGVNIDTAAVPDVSALTECLVSGFDAVLGLSGGRAAES
ncbi:wax ester/triacylglycerol synthase domain-containing protein [Nocardia cyriacigeorgica]|uniref:wax ester/triacylglycerol synthase domain-containing protein n=1 Tax=Nocardia cyriacigeorgica TaxID=135487 RepID=UPI000662A372|nr:wax ester/triacylglycerol synthase domain-containing protein [Nocardia cyriacigeorgica]BDT87303.1 putative diacyglycerol O-acyltransferase [Nocardia cyriacigeorgica]